MPSENVESEQCPMGIYGHDKKKKLNSRKSSSIYTSCVSEVARCESEAGELNDTLMSWGPHTHEVTNEFPGDDLYFLRRYLKVKFCLGFFLS